MPRKKKHDLVQGVEGLMSRIRRAVEDDDPSLVLAPEAVHDANRLLKRASKRGTPDLMVVQTVAWLHWCRYRALPEGENLEDGLLTMTLFARVYQERPDAVPEQIQVGLKQFISEPDSPREWTAQGLRLLSSYEDSGNPSAIKAAIDLFSRALGVTPAGHPARGGTLSNLGVAWQTRFEQTGKLAHLDQAVAARREATVITAADHPRHSIYLFSLSDALSTRFERTGNLADINEATIAARGAVDAVPADHPDRAVYLANLGDVLEARFRRAGNLADADEAVSVRREAVAAVPADDPHR